jgi:hypothetical protein
MSEVEPQTQPDETPDEMTPDEPGHDDLDSGPNDEDAEEDAQTPDDPQPDKTKPEQPQALSEKQLEARLKRLDKASQTWRERVGTIMEDDAAMLMPCPLCEQIIPGFVMPTPATPERFPAVRTFMGDAEPQEWQQDPNTRTCQTCDGMGEVKTGSKVQSQTTLVCTDCGGKGWQGARPAVATSGPMAAVVTPEQNGADTPKPQGPEPPEAAKLRALGYTLIQPVGA